MPPTAPSADSAAPASAAPVAPVYDSYDRTSATRFPVAVDAALQDAGWRTGRWDIQQAEHWADALRAHASPAGHRHTVFPAAVEAWAEFGGLDIVPTGPGRHIAPTPFTLDPLHGLHLARTLGDLGRALETDVAPLGQEAGGQAVLAIDTEGRVYSLDHTGDWYLGADIDQALSTLVLGTRPTRLGPAGTEDS
ncbi:SUKH-3 domain containing protein [Streptomyces sp. CB02923]|uniref:SUKH-3 domain-containing protein n=1 Tax=Streptomyces sp. CB02923 TaxID=1718985 RepID=UPI00093F85A5|nr:SUKH-3 domain-containing protein [Streptomyces sp. CB02923]OKH97707.1 SUKH-3 domain containing protein [Streptomyces sp. CB02923]